MQDFLKAFYAIKKDIVQIKISIQDINNIKSCILKNLGLKNENELRDKFEGVTFYQNFHRKIVGIIALEKYLKMTLVNLEKIQPKDYYPIVNIQDKQVIVQTTDFGLMPQNEIGDDYPIIYTVKKDERTIWIIGFSKNKHNSTKRNITSFDGLNNFKNFEELKELLS